MGKTQAMLVSESTRNRGLFSLEIFMICIVGIAGYDVFVETDFITAFPHALNATNKHGFTDEQMTRVS